MISSLLRKKKWIALLEHRFNIQLLARRLLSTTDWILQSARYKSLKLGYFGASTGAAAALVAAAERAGKIYAIVSRGGRPDLAGSRVLNCIDALVFRIYNLNKEDIDTVMNALSMSSKYCQKVLNSFNGY